jgi:hypothetical protein
MHLTARTTFARVAVAMTIVVGPAGRAAPGRPNDAEDAYGAALTRAVAAKERALDVNEPPRWEEALRLFQEAAALRYTRECGYEIGVAAEHLSRNDLAVEGYEAAIDLGLVGPPRARAQAFVAAHASGMGRLALRGAPGRVVYVAGVRRGRLPLQRPLVLFPGEVRLEIVELSGVTNGVTVRLRSGQLEVLDLDKKPPASKPPVADAPPPPAPPVAVPQPAAPSRADPPSGPSEPPPPSPSLAAAGDVPGPEPEAVISSRGLWIAGIGAAVTVAAIVLIPVSSSQIAADRSDLMKECASPVMNDSCTALLGHGPAAQSLADSIATWKAISTGAKIGLGVGLVTVAGGLLLRYRDGANAAVARPALVLDQEGGRLLVGLAWASRF